MTAKELRQSLRRHTFVFPFLGIQLMALVATSLEFSKGHEAGFSEHAGLLNIALLFTSGPFWMVAGAVCMVIMPLAGLLLMGQEIEDGNHQLLLLTRLNRWKIVLGKFVCLWGLAALTFTSLLPYVVVRYMIGGVEWWHEAACAGTVLGGSAIIAAGALGASAFKRTPAKLGIFMLFLGSMLATCGLPLFTSAMVSHGCGVFYHITAVAAIGCYSALGLALARSRLRLAVLAYEVNPSATLIGILVFAPFVTGLITAVTVGWGGGLALLGIGVVAVRADLTPRAPKWAPPPPPQLPEVKI